MMPLLQWWWLQLLSSLLAVRGAAASVEASGTLAAPELPPDWSIDRRNRLHMASEPMTIGFLLRKKNTQKLREALERVSDPTSASYGEYLTWEQANALSAADAEEVKLLERWLEGESIKSKRVGAGLVEATLPIHRASKLLGTHFYRVHGPGEIHAVRAGDVSVPKDVAGVLAGITGLYGLPVPRGPLLSGEAKVKVTPDILHRTYKVSPPNSDTISSRQAIVSLLDQTMNASDLETFFKAFLPNSPASDATLSKFVGDPGLGKGMPEASLDIEYIKGVAPAALTEFWYFAGNDFCGLLKRWTATLMDTKDPPLVHSVSYGWQGDLASVGCDEGIINDIETDLAALACRGITIAVSSGDSGSGWQAPDCTDVNLRLQHTAVKGTLGHSFHAWSVPQCCGTANSGGYFAWSFDGHTCSMYETVEGTTASRGVTSGGDLVVKRKQTLWPSWPASSPVVTSVGATRFEAAAGSEEVASTSFGSGGGFSTLFKAPSYQQRAVKRYLANLSAHGNLPPEGSYPPDGRGTPDVSLLGEGYQVFVNGGLQSADGTSASAPSFAAMVTLLNAARSQAGMPPMGFMNPFLYQNEDAFTDVVKGHNRIGMWGPLRYGWDCTEGWDAVTGLGTPDYGKLEEAALHAGKHGKRTQVRQRRHRGDSASAEAAAALQKVAAAQHRMEVTAFDVGSFLQEPQVPKQVEL